jgi:hypothetical protein
VVCLVKGFDGDPAECDNEKPPPVLIESVSFVDAKRGIQRPAMGSSSPLRLPPGSSQIEIQFTGLSYTAPEKMKFSYRLEREGQLISTEQIVQRTVSFNLLPAGAYTLRFTASNNDGVWNREGAALSFTVLPFFWQTFWFRLSTLVGMAAGIGGLFWRTTERRVRIQREKFEQQKALAEERAAAEMALRQSEAKFQKAFHSSPDALAIATLAEGRLLAVNEA